MLKSQLSPIFFNEIGNGWANVDDGNSLGFKLRSDAYSVRTPFLSQHLYSVLFQLFDFFLDIYIKSCQLL
jgi:hypothetical protein